MALCRKIALNNAKGRRKGHRPALGSGIVIDTNTGVLNSFAVKRGSGVKTNSMILRRIPPGYAIINIPKQVIHVSGGGIPEDSVSRMRLPSPMLASVQRLRRRGVGLRGHLRSVVGCVQYIRGRGGRDGGSRSLWCGIGGGEEIYSFEKEGDGSMYVQSSYVWLRPC